MGILTLLLCASGLGLPMLMDPARCSIYYVYLLILTLTVLMDGILYLIFMRRLFTIPRSVLSVILTVSIVGSMIHQGMIKMPGFGSDYVTAQISLRMITELLAMDLMTCIHSVAAIAL